MLDFFKKDGRTGIDNGHMTMCYTHIWSYGRTSIDNGHMTMCHTHIWSYGRTGIDNAEWLHWLGHKKLLMEDNPNETIIKPFPAVLSSSSCVVLSSKPNPHGGQPQVQRVPRLAYDRSHMTMCVTHIWSYDHALYPYMVM